MEPSGRSRSRIRKQEREKQPNAVQQESMADTLDATSQDANYPSDAEVEEAETLKRNLEEKHKETRRELARQFRSRSRDEQDIGEELKTAKARSRARLSAASINAEPVPGGDADGEGVEDTPRGRKRRELRHKLREEAGREGADGAKSVPRLSLTPDADDGVVREDGPQPGAAGDESLSASAARPPRIDRKALAANIREKMLAKKAEADKKLVEERGALEETAPERQFRGQRDAPLTTRFDEDPNAMDEDTWRSRMSSIRAAEVKEPTWEELQQKATVSDKEALDFFCRDWDPEPEAAAEQEPEPTEQGEEQAGPITEQPLTSPRPQKDDDESPLLQEIELRYKSSIDFVVVARADYVPHNDRLETERDMLYVPSVIELPLDQRIEHEPRYLEEEGLYVGRPPQVDAVNIRRLENRLVTEGVFEWFGEDGKIALLPDPLKEIPCRPLLWDDQYNPIPDELKTDMISAIPAETARRMLTGVTPDTTYQLEVEVHSVAFTHHHLFSKEHVLAQSLRELYIQYESVVERDWVGYCQQRIHALKHAVIHLDSQLQLHKNHPDRAGLVADMEQRTDEFSTEIRHARRARNQEEGKLRNLQVSILKTWRQIKESRQQTGVTNTQLKLKIRKEATDREADEERLRQDVEDELAEEREAFDKSYRNQLADYKKKLNLFEEQKNKKATAMKRQQRREQGGQVRRSRENVRADDQLEMDSRNEREDTRVLAEPDLEQPTAPTPFDEEGTRDRIRAGIQRNRRLPGEPKIYITLTDAATITPDNLCPRAELQRRRDLAKYRYFVKIHFNYKQVETTDIKELNADFTINFTRIYPIQILQYPEIITLQLFERSGLSTRSLGSIDLPTPDTQSVAGRVRPEAYNFFSSRLVHYQHEGVGSGQPMALEAVDASGEAMVVLWTRGRLHASTAWGADEDGVPLAPYMSHGGTAMMNDLRGRGDAVASLGANNLTDLDKVTKWEAEAHLDPNDPRDAKLMNLIEGSPADDPHQHHHADHDHQQRIHASDYFRLDHLQEEFNFATDEDLDQSNRFKLIQLRDREIPDFKNLSVPATEKEVSVDLFKDYEEQRKKKPDMARGFEARRILHQQFIDQVREEVLQKFRLALHQKTLKEVVVEEEIPSMIALIPALMRLLEARRPLHPIREPRKRIHAQNLREMDVEILINVISANNVPVRVEHKDKIVKPFVEVRFQDEVRITTVADGPNPSWNMEMRIPFKPPAKMTSLETIGDVVLINLYDEVVETTPADTANQWQTTFHQRIEKHWLGSLEIPFTTIYLNSKVEGKFKLNTPPVLLSYQMNAQGAEETTNRTLISVFLTLDPAIHPPEPLKERFESDEDEHLLHSLTANIIKVRRRFPDRVVKSTVVNMQCREVIATRYVASLNPPEELMPAAMGNDKEVSMRMIARYVSLIPFISDALCFPGLSDIWSTCDQFLKMLCGDDEEHAVLLCNYFLNLEPEPDRVFLCLGQAIPEGPTAYVLTMEGADQKVFLWNAGTGERYSIFDRQCPMKSIGCLIGPNNIWANVQPKDRPLDVQFDLNQPSQWLPLFGKGGMPADMQRSVQPAQVVYTPSDPRDIQGLKFEIETMLRDRLMEWRKGQVTRLNYEFMRELSTILENLEKYGGRYYEGMETSLNKITAKYTVYGFPINLPYMETPDIVARVHATGIHANTAKSVEFAVAVYIKGYPNSVLSIWIYVASLIKRP